MTFAHAGRYGPESFTFPSGAEAGGAAVTVRDLAGDLAELFVDRDRSAPVANPTALDELGNLTLYAEPGSYTLEIDGGYGSIEFEVGVAVDPADVGGATPDGVALLAAANTFTERQVVDLEALPAAPTFVDALLLRGNGKDLARVASTDADLSGVGDGPQLVLTLLALRMDNPLDPPASRQLVAAAVPFGFDEDGPQYAVGLISVAQISDVATQTDQRPMPLLIKGLDNTQGFAIHSEDLAAAVATLASQAALDIQAARIDALVAVPPGLVRDVATALDSRDTGATGEAIEIDGSAIAGMFVDVRDGDVARPSFVNPGEGHYSQVVITFRNAAASFRADIEWPGYVNAGFTSSTPVNTSSWVCTILGTPDADPSVSAVLAAQFQLS